LAITGPPQVSHNTLVSIVDHFFEPHACLIAEADKKNINRLVLNLCGASTQ
jgi:hypothetical protein